MPNRDSGSPEMSDVGVQNLCLGDDFPTETLETSPQGSCIIREQRQLQFRSQARVQESQDEAPEMLATIIDRLISH